MDKTRDQTHRQTPYPAPLMTPHPVPDPNENIDFWVSVAQALTGEEFELVKMRYKLNMTQEEISEKVGITQQAVWKRLNRIKKKLRERL